MADSKKDVSNDIDLAVTAGSVGDVPYGLAPQLPITFNRRDGIANIKNYKLLALQNLKMLVLTIPGERIMDPEFGVGIYALLFENFSSEMREDYVVMGKVVGSFGINGWLKIKSFSEKGTFLFNP